MSSPLKLKKTSKLHFGVGAEEEEGFWVLEEAILGQVLWEPEDYKRVEDQLAHSQKLTFGPPTTYI